MESSFVYAEINKHRRGLEATFKVMRNWANVRYYILTVLFQSFHVYHCYLKLVLC